MKTKTRSCQQIAYTSSSNLNFSLLLIVYSLDLRGHTRVDLDYIPAISIFIYYCGLFCNNKKLTKIPCLILRISKILRRCKNSNVSCVPRWNPQALIFYMRHSYTIISHILSPRLPILSHLRNIQHSKNDIHK